MFGKILRNAAVVWDGFWFSRSDPFCLAIIRAFAGGIIFYTHVVWTIELESFFSSDQILPVEHHQLISGSSFVWSHFYWMPSFSAAIVAHYIGLVAMLFFCIGFLTRYSGILTLFFAISYANRAIGATFGLDQLNVMLALYCVLGPSGSAFSVDRILHVRREKKRLLGNRSGTHDLQSTNEPGSVLATVAIRCIQIHLCVIYLFAGWGKLLGSTWWNGEAIWGAIANSEYQTIDLTWLAAFPFFINAMTLVSLVWEVSYVFLIWPQWSRPIMLFLAVAVHLGIGLAMGMMEFGLIMLTANIAFVSPKLLRRITGCVAVNF
jgi:hypothetical protein